MSTKFAIDLTMDNEIDGKRLVQIAVRHTKLALEHIKRGTSLEQKEQIHAQINELRIEREAIINKYKR